MGRGIVQPVDIMANPPWSEDLLDYLATLSVRPSLRPERVDGPYRHIAGLSIAARLAEAGLGRGTDYVFRGPRCGG